MNVIDNYIIECITNSKPYSGKKVNNLKTKTGEDHLPLEILYSKAKNKKIPFCEKCGLNEVKLKSTILGYSKYCSTDCYRLSQSERNKENNSQLNKSKSEKLKTERITPLFLAKEYYLNNDYTTIKEVSKKFDLSLGSLRKYLADLGLTDRQRSLKMFLKNTEIKMKSTLGKLDDLDWVKEKLGAGWTSRNFSESLGCSRNYVCVQLKERGISLSDYFQSSSYEVQLQDLLTEWQIPFIKNDRKVLEGKEIDILLENKNVGIEINGVYWHQDLNDLDINYHLNKTLLAEKKGLRLLHITDKEIDTKLEKVTSLIRSSVGLNDKIYARQCTIKEISSKEYNEFMEHNHMQNSVNSSIRIGLFYKDSLVSAMGISKSRFDKAYEYEIIRFCNKLYLNVVGGASKMFNFFLKKYNPSSIISYCQRRLFSGSVYENMGMKKVRYTPPSYVWIHNSRKDDIRTRYQSQRHKITECPDEMTEVEYMTKEGYLKIYDCGQIVFEFKDK